MKSDELETAQNGVDLLRTLAWALLAIALVLCGAGDLPRRRAPARDPARGRHRVHPRRRAGARSSTAPRATRSSSRSPTSPAPTPRSTTCGRSAPRSSPRSPTPRSSTGSSSCSPPGSPARPRWRPRSARRSPPGTASLAYAYGALAVVLILLFWWDPTEGTHRLVPSLLLIVAARARHRVPAPPGRARVPRPGDHRLARRGSRDDRRADARGARARGRGPGERRSRARCRRRRPDRRARAAREAARRRRAQRRGARRREAADPVDDSPRSGRWPAAPPARGPAPAPRPR